MSTLRSDLDLVSPTPKGSYSSEFCPFKDSSLRSRMTMKGQNVAKDLGGTNLKMARKKSKKSTVCRDIAFGKIKAATIKGQSGTSIIAAGLA